MRNTLMVLHRWTALAVSLLLIGTAASGAVIVFEGAIDRATHPALWHATPIGPTLPIDTIVARVETKFPDSKVVALNPTPVPDRAWTMNAGPITVFVNPYTGEINGTRTQKEAQSTLSRRMHVFHVEFLAGKVGREIVGVLTAIALFLVVTGVILWWPDKLIRVTTTASWKRINFDLHHALGIIASLVLIVIMSSGLVIHYDALTNLVKSLDQTPPPPPPTQSAGAPDAPRLSFDAVAATARAALPGADIMVISLGNAKNPGFAGMRFPEDHTPGGRSRVYVDHFTGALLSTSSTRDAPLGTRIDNLKRSLHTGDVMGKPTEAVWLLATLVLLSQIVTGVLMWLNARKGRTRT